MIALSGELGAGKTTFVQGLARALGIPGRITSPTFIIFNKHAIPRARRMPWRYLYHVDLYRIRSPRDMRALGFREMLAKPENLVVIEWADRVKRLIPRTALWIQFRHGRHPSERIVVVR